MKNIFVTCPILIALCLLSLLYFKYDNNKKKVIGTIGAGPNEVGFNNPFGRAAWEFNRLKDPATNKIPDNIKFNELEFARTLPNDLKLKSKSINWVKRGPFNVGGRTRGIAMDINNENRILAGGVNGGIWQTTDGGLNWNKITKSYQLHSVTCIAQDRRLTKTNTWYYGTGEAYGASAAATGAFFLGSGIYKSTDNGLTWDSLPHTSSNTPNSFDKNWDLVWNIAVDNSVDSIDVVWAACYGSLFKTTNGGNTWDSVLYTSGTPSYFSDVAVTSTGVVYATFSSEGLTKGIWRCADRVTWKKITPVGFPGVYDRIVIGINPQNENSVYFLGVTPDFGQSNPTWVAGDTSWTSLWKYTYLSGDGSGSGGIWTDLSSNIPHNGTSTFDNFYAQGSYDLVIKFKPNDSNVVFIGGTNIYRSTDGFTSSNNITQIGGYQIGTSLPDFHIYPNHHPDQHNILFLPSNPSVMITGSDGGIHRTNDCLAPSVTWQRLNNGYLTTQVYTVTIDESSTNDIIVGGFQDNGNFFTNSASPTANWVMPLNGDGAFGAITNNGQTYYLSIQNGKVFKMTIDNNGNSTGFRRIDPIGAKNYVFINPFVVDPNDSNIMYLAAGHKLWRNDSLGYIPITNSWDSISKGWIYFHDTVTTTITAVAVSKTPANIVFYGTSNKKIYKIINANTGNPSRIDITPTIFQSGGNVSCIAIDPNDANNIIVTFSNYNIYSLFYTTNGGTSWTKGAGNLEQNSSGSGNGPSIRWASFLPINGKNLYLVGTSIGLFATDTLQGLNTQWVQLGTNTIGNVVVEMIKTRESDGLVVVATHGTGIFSTHITSINDIFAEIKNCKNVYSLSVNVFPNPASESISISFDLPDKLFTRVVIYDKSGKLVKIVEENELLQGGHRYNIDINKYSSGMYFCVIETEKKKNVAKFVVLK